MEDVYDIVVCGTGLVECILSGLLSQEGTPACCVSPFIGKKVLHIDKNSYYGGEGASVNLTNLWKIFRPDQSYPEYLGHNRDWNIDLIPKFIMSNGKLVKTLLKTKVSRYLEWKCTHIHYYSISPQRSKAPTSTRCRRTAISVREARRSRRSRPLTRRLYLPT